MKNEFLKKSTHRFDLVFKTETEIADEWRHETLSRAVDLDQGVATLVSADSVRTEVEVFIKKGEMSRDAAKKSGIYFSHEEVMQRLDETLEAAWEREADKREAEIASGVATFVPGTETMARLRSKL